VNDPIIPRGSVWNDLKKRAEGLRKNAPDMLEALHTIAELSGDGAKGLVLRRIFRVASAAISKAEGRS
jgi:hypothetical protein